MQIKFDCHVVEFVHVAMLFLGDISYEKLREKTVLLRAGLNLPLGANGRVIDDFRLKKALPTIRYLAENCKKLVIIAHIGRNRDISLKPVIDVLNEHISHYDNIEVYENLRQDPREYSDKESDRDEYAKELIQRSGADLFVQDAFSVCHRNHASITSIPKFLQSCAGFLIEKELLELNKALNPLRPSIFILGGAKFATKEPLIRKFLKLYDKIFIGGAIANEFFESRGYEIGHSLTHKSVIPHDILYNENILLPEFVSVVYEDYEPPVEVKPKDILPEMKIVDVTLPVDLFKNEYASVLWNGPLGYYEAGFIRGTDTLLRMLHGLRRRDPDACIITGGGDTLATISAERRNIFTHISSGGGAMLTYLEKGNLPGLLALQIQ